MLIIGCDLHTRYQQIALLDTTTGEVVTRRLEHENGEARAFYASLQGPVRVGIEATGGRLAQSASSAICRQEEIKPSGPYSRETNH
jgi:hypothetical protein